MLYAIHGFTGTDLSWSDVLEPTHLQYRSLLMPGHGWRPCPPETSLPSLAAEIAAGLPDDGSADLIGYSMGGRIALQTALDHPGRVRRLVLVSSCPGISDPAERHARLLQDDALAEILEQDGIGTFLAWWENSPTLRPGRELNEGDLAVLRSRRLNQDPEGLAAAIRCLGQGRMTPLWDRLGELSVPVLLVCGDEDCRYTNIMRAMHQRLPRSELVVLDACGHAVHREDEKELIRLTLDFLIRPYDD